MHGMFIEALNFNVDLSGWDVSNVWDLGRMFESCPFNQDIGSWNLESAISTQKMFMNNSAFNQDISNWDVSDVTNMHMMFNGASSFDQDISNWDVAGVTVFFDMFLDAVALSDENKCAIHTNFSANSNWPYDWSELCTVDNGNFSLTFDGDDDRVNLNDLNYISEGIEGEYTVITNFRFNSLGTQQFIYGDERNGNNGVMMQLNNNLLVTYFSSGYGN